MRAVALIMAGLAMATNAWANPIIQRFVPKPRLEAPRNLETAAMAVLRRHEASLRARLARTPDDAQLRHTLGTALYHQGKIGEARSIWAAAADKDPSLAPAAVMADIHRVFVLLREGKRAEARQQMDAAQKRHADNPHFHLMRGEQAARSRNFDAAEH